MLSSKSMCLVHKVAGVLVLVGALNWGLVGAFEFNLVSTVLGQWVWVERIVYILIGLSALSMLCLAKCCGDCGGSCSGKCEGGKCER